MKLSYQLLIAAFVISLAGGLIWSANHYHTKYQDEKQRADTAENKLILANATITDQQTRQRDVAALDAKYMKELSDAKAENDALQRKLDNGGRVLVKGKCPVPATAETASTTIVGNDETIELSPVAGRNVLGIRSGILSDQAALRTLQEYISTQCLR